jgi:hypothetical protein
LFAINTLFLFIKTHNNYEEAKLYVQSGLTMQQAFDAVYTSRLFLKVSDPKTGLYFQSSGYVYSFLDSELKTGNVK